MSFSISPPFFFSPAARCCRCTIAFVAAMIASSFARRSSSRSGSSTVGWSRITSSSTITSTKPLEKCSHGTWISTFLQWTSRATTGRCFAASFLVISSGRAYRFLIMMLPSFTTMSEYLVPPCSPIASTVLSFLVTTSSMRLLIMYIAIALSV